MKVGITITEPVIITIMREIMTVILDVNSTKYCGSKKLRSLNSLKKLSQVYVRTYSPGMLKSMVSKSTEKRDVIRPDGVELKKERGAPEGIL